MMYRKTSPCESAVSSASGPLVLLFALMAAALVFFGSAVAPGAAFAEDSAGAGGAEAAYAMFYDDGTLVFQRGDERDASHGALAGKYTDFEDEVYDAVYRAPWYGVAPAITAVEFSDTIRPASTAYWFDGFIACASIADAGTGGVAWTMLDTSRVSDMSNMFSGCLRLSALDLSSFDTSQVTDLSGMFQDCVLLASVDLLSFDTAQVMDMSFMFAGCAALTSLDLSAFDTAQVRDMSRTFDGCMGLERIYASAAFSAEGACCSEGTFGGCVSLSGGAGTAFWNVCGDPSCVRYAHVDDPCNPGYLTFADVRARLYSDGTLVFQLRDSWDWSHGWMVAEYARFECEVYGDASEVPWYDDRESILAVEFAASVTPQSTAYWFSGLSACESIGNAGAQGARLTKLHTVRVADMSGMFAGCSSLTSLDLSRVDTDNVANMSALFERCTSLLALRLKQGARYADSAETCLRESVWRASDSARYASTDEMLAGNALRAEAGSMGYTSTISEVAGANRYATAAEAALEAFPNGADCVILATGESFPDALGASSLAGLLDCPILLTESCMLRQEAADAIATLGASRIVVVGGVAAVSEQVEAACKAMLANPEEDFVRIAGQNRYETSEEIYVYGAAQGAWGTTAIVTTGITYPDAVSASGYAFAHNAPIFLVDGANGLTRGAQVGLEAGGFERVLVMGGEAAVPASVDEWVLEHLGIETQRLAGANRYATSEAAARFVADEDGAVSGACIATARNFPDALTGSVLAGKSGYLIMLADEDGTNAFSVLAEYAGTVEHVYVLGGTAAVSQTVRDAAEQAAGL